MLGDWAAQRWPRHGRVTVCQISVGVGVPLSVLLFKASELLLATAAPAAAPRLPSPLKRGRSSLFCTPLLVQGLPLSASAGASVLYAFVLIITGLSITWAETGKESGWQVA